MQHDTTLAQSKQTLAGALKNLQDQTKELGATEERLAQSEKQQRDILATAAMVEEEQIEALSKIVALGQILKSRIEQGRLRLEDLKGELHAQTEAAFKVFFEDLTWLRDERTAKNMAILQAMTDPARWPIAEETGKAFIRHAKDLVPIDLLGDHAHNLLRGGAIRQAAEQLLSDVATLEREAGR